MQVVRMLGGYVSLALWFNMIDEVLPMYASAPRSQGGLGLPASVLSLPLATGGLALVAFSLLGYGWAPSCTVIPSLTFLDETGAW